MFCVYKFARTMCKYSPKLPNCNANIVTEFNIIFTCFDIHSKNQATTTYPIFNVFCQCRPVVASTNLQPGLDHSHMCTTRIGMALLKFLIISFNEVLGDENYLKKLTFIYLHLYNVIRFFVVKIFSCAENARKLFSPV